MNGGDFSWELILDEVTQVRDDEGIPAWDGPGRAILREPGPGLTGESGSTFTREYTGTAVLLEYTGTAVLLEYTGTAMLLEDAGKLAFADL